MSAKEYRGRGPGRPSWTRSQIGVSRLFMALIMQHLLPPWPTRLRIMFAVPSVPNMRSGNRIRSMSPEDSSCVEVEAVTKSFGSQRAVDGLSLRIDGGEVHALLGPNGSGKSTTVRLIATLLRPDAGEVRVLSHDTVRDAS